MKVTQKLANNIQPHRVEGNPQVRSLLLHWLAECDKGRLNAMGICVCDGVNMHLDFSAAQGASEYMLHFGLQSMAQKLGDRIWGRQAPRHLTEVNEKTDPSKVVYNAANLTLGYDFLAWLVGCEMRKHSLGIDKPLKVAVSYGTTTVNNYGKMMRNEVVLPLIKMIGAEYVSESEIGTDAMWPPTSCFLEAVEFHNDGIPAPEFRTDKKSPFEGEYVTITLREATHWPQRNADLHEWRRIARWLREHGETVVFVRDTEKAEETIGQYPTCPEASTNLETRAALYRDAKCNLFMSNGPATLDWFCGKAPSLSFIPLDATSGYKCEDPKWWPGNHGIMAGGQFPWFKDRPKRIVWKKPSFMNVTRAYQEHMDMLAMEKNRAAQIDSRSRELEGIVSRAANQPNQSEMVGRHPKSGNSGPLISQQDAGGV